MQSKISQSSPKNPVNIASEKQFLRFYLEPETTLMLPIEQVTEVLKLSLKKIVPIPQMPPWVVGVYNWRGEILWTIDLGHLLGLNSWQKQDLNLNYATTLILSVGDDSSAQGSAKNSVGLIIKRVEDIEWCAANLIQLPPPSLAESPIAAFIEGYWLKSTAEMIFVLNGQSLVKAIN